MAERARTDETFAGFEAAPGPPGDWTRLANEALGGNFETLRSHLDEGESQCVGWCPLCRLADVIRANATPEMREQWSSVQRELLLAVRALADHYLAEEGRRKRGQGPRVEDIPIE